MTAWQTMRTCFLAAAVLAVSPQAHAEDLKEITIFSGPVPAWDPIWMADAKGFYKDEGLKATIRVFPTGTTALQAFQAGQGDIVANGDLPSVRYWVNSNKDYRVITVIERDSAQYVAAALKTINSARDLEGKTIGTRVGSTGSWFISEYLTKNGVAKDKVKVINLDAEVLPTALCGKDISAFFLWDPFATRATQICPDATHILTNAEGYIHGYSVVGARPGWLDSPQGSDLAIRFLRATLKGKQVAEKDPEAVAAYGKEHFGLNEADVRQLWKIYDRSYSFDKTFYADYCSLSSWMQGEKMMSGPIDFNEFVWTKGLQAIDPKRVEPPPSHC